MHELRSILQGWRSLDASQQDAVLVTVVHVAGSAYRRPGARMLISQDGNRLGTISGGCLEGEIVQKAWWYTDSAKPVVRVYDTSSDDDAVWEFGLGCNGVVHLLLERLQTSSAREMLEFVEERQKRREWCVVATVIRGSAHQPGDRLLMDCDGVAGGTLQGTSSARIIAPHAQAALREKRSRLVRLDDVEVFVECICPPRSLVVLGAGHDALPVVATAKQLGWDVTVADGRPAYANPQRFAQADHVVVLRHGDPLGDISITRDTAVVMMTHNYPLDLRLLPGVIAARPRYLGILGPHSRAERLFADCGLTRPEFVHAPVGLDLGCDNPAAVALSIIAEIQAVFSGRAAGMLRQRTAAIHDPVHEVAESAAVLPFEPARPTFCETTLFP